MFAINLLYVSNLFGTVPVEILLERTEFASILLKAPQTGVTMSKLVRIPGSLSLTTTGMVLVFRSSSLEFTRYHLKHPLDSDWSSS